MQSRMVCRLVQMDCWTSRPQPLGFSDCPNPRTPPSFHLVKIRSEATTCVSKHHPPSHSQLWWCWCCWHGDPCVERCSKAEISNRLQEAIPYTPMGHRAISAHLFGRYNCGWRLLAGGLGIGLSMSLCTDDPSACTAAWHSIKWEWERGWEALPPPSVLAAPHKPGKKGSKHPEPQNAPRSLKSDSLGMRVGDQGLQKLPWRTESMQTGRWKWRWKPLYIYI